MEIFLVVMLILIFMQLAGLNVAMHSILKEILEAKKRRGQ